MTEKSRAKYFKERRKDKRAFYVEIEAEKMEQFEDNLNSKSKTKKDWLNEKIDEGLKKIREKPVSYLGGYTSFST